MKKLETTKNYGLFELDPMNRDIGPRPKLEASLRKHGFMPSKPIQVVIGANGKLRVVSGHHRLFYARKLGLPVWYVIDDSNTNLYDLEGDTGSRWSLRDFAVSYAKAGDAHCIKLLAYSRDHQIPLAAAASMLGGETAGSGNQMAKVKEREFRVRDAEHAAAVASVTDHLRGLGIAFATQSSLVTAISKALRVPQVDPKILKHRAAQCPGELKKCATSDDYLLMLEALYNRGARANRLPLAHLAMEAARRRNVVSAGPATAESAETDADQVKH